MHFLLLIIAHAKPSQGSSQSNEEVTNNPLSCLLLIFFSVATEMIVNILINVVVAAAVVMITILYLSALSRPGCWSDDTGMMLSATVVSLQFPMLWLPYP